jgi:TolB-like protein/DNA-binding winged helix-turn-helix (wHTH) protein/tetratricopeptide (TPR) repeat protein
VDGYFAGAELTFGRWRFDRRHGGLFRKDEAGEWVPASLGSRALAVLAVLLREPGALVSKDVLMDAVWPDVAVEANNLSVQIAALRRVLDEGRAEDSYIQTVPGRGYRFAIPIVAADPIIPAADPSCGATTSATRRRRPVGIFMAFAAFLLLAAAYGASRYGRTPAADRMSIVVLPFANLSGNHAEDYLADAITDDLTSELALTTKAFVVSARTAHSYVERGLAPPQLGRELGVRYILQGSERRIGSILRVNAQLLSAETAALLWTDLFDVSVTDLGAGQEEAVSRIRDATGLQMIATEAARSQQERPNNPDALDLLLRARSLQVQPASPGREAEVRSLLERAMRLDPASDVIKGLLIDVLLDDEDFNPHGRKAVLERTSALMAELGQHRPQSWAVLTSMTHWLSWQYDRCAETIDAAERFLDRYPNAPTAASVNRWLGDCLTRTGHAAEALPALRRALQHDIGAMQSHNDRNLQYATLLLGQYEDSLHWGERALAANPDDSTFERARVKRRLAAAYALTHRLDMAKATLAEASRLQPFTTLRGVAAVQNPPPAYAEAMARIDGALRDAGMRDHADEAADFGTPPQRDLRQSLSGPTSRSVAGATTLRTDDLPRLLADRKPVVIDSLTNFSGRSIAGAIGLRYVGNGGDLNDIAQDRLRTRLTDLTNGDATMPIVAVGWNSECFDGSNLALRLVALGYKNVYWYRGGREAWEVRGLPEADLVAQDW